MASIIFAIFLMMFGNYNRRQNDFVNAMKQTFQQVLIRKPKASRSRSNEIYLLGKNLKA